MSGGGAATLDDILAREALRDCVRAYARGLDRLDRSLILSAFHPDATFNNGNIRGTPAEFCDQLLAHQDERLVVQHYLTNSSFEVSGDEAHGETYFHAVIRYAGTRPYDVMGGRYVDRFERRAGVWGITARVLLREWHFEAPAPTASTFLATTLDRGTRDRHDASYERPLRA